MHTILIDGANSYDYVKAGAHSKSSCTAFVFSILIHACRCSASLHAKPAMISLDQLSQNAPLLAPSALSG